MSLNKKAKELADLIMKTNEFNELKQFKKDADQNKDLKSKIDVFNKRQTSLINSNLPDKEIKAKIEELNKTFESLSKIPEMEKLLKAEKRFNTLTSEVYKYVNDLIIAGLK